MTRWKKLLPYGALALCLIPAVSAAEQIPAGNAYDSRMRMVPYNPGQVVHLSTTVGDTMVVGFAADETVTAVAETDTIHLAALPKGNYLFLKPNAALPLQPIIVLTQRASGDLRRYVFEFETVPTQTAANGASGVFYSVQFSYPADEAAAAAAQAAADAAKTEKLNAASEARAEQVTADDIMTNAVTNPYAGPRNYRYTAQGSHSLAPVAVWDNGYSTVMTFPGNTNMPSVFVVNPDGKEATASYAVKGSTIEIGQTAREFRLRYGGTVINIYNLGYNSVGQNPGTGTTSSAVTRVISSSTDLTGAGP